MLIWIGVVGTVLALAGIAALVVLYLLLIKVHQASASLHQTSREFSEALKQDAQLRISNFKALTDGFETILGMNSDRIERADKEMLEGVKLLRQAWESLATEITTRYQNYDKAQRLALRQIAAVEYLEKLTKSISGKRPRVSDNVSTPSEGDAAAMEELTEEQKMMFTTAASGLDRSEQDF